jgi:hypothetical protein
MGRWNPKEAAALNQLKILIKVEHEHYLNFPDVGGERRLMRFLRGRNLNVELAAQEFIAFVKWRKDNNIDDVRSDILYGGKNNPTLFPHADVMLRLLPQIVIAPFNFDKIGQPLCLEIYSFDPNALFESVTMEQYLLFLFYTLEYRALILEQIDHDRELKYLCETPNELERIDGYCHITRLCCIRDLQGAFDF